MYDFDEQQWDQQEAEIYDWRRPREGWLIAKSPHMNHFHDSFEEESAYLQIATGQWCCADHATLFPLRSAAVVYAQEFGLVADRSVRIVAHRY